MYYWLCEKIFNLFQLTHPPIGQQAYLITSSPPSHPLGTLPSVSTEDWQLEDKEKEQANKTIQRIKQNLISVFLTLRGIFFFICPGRGTNVLFCLPVTSVWMFTEKATFCVCDWASQTGSKKTNKAALFSACIHRINQFSTSLFNKSWTLTCENKHKKYN